MPTTTTIPTPQEIVFACCVTFGIGHDEFAGTGRMPQAVKARTVCAWLMRNRIPGISGPEIARAMGRPNHSSIFHAIKRAEAAIAAGDTTYADYIAAAETKIAAMVERRCGVTA